MRDASYLDMYFPSKKEILIPVYKLVGSCILEKLVSRTCQAIDRYPLLSACMQFSDRLSLHSANKIKLAVLCSRLNLLS